MPILITDKPRIIIEGIDDPLQVDELEWEIFNLCSNWFEIRGFSSNISSESKPGGSEITIKLEEEN